MKTWVRAVRTGDWTPTWLVRQGISVSSGRSPRDSKQNGDWIQQAQPSPRPRLTTNRPPGPPIGTDVQNWRPNPLFCRHSRTSDRDDPQNHRRMYKVGVRKITEVWRDTYDEPKSNCRAVCDRLTPIHSAELSRWLPYYSPCRHLTSPRTETVVPNGPSVCSACAFSVLLAAVHVKPDTRWHWGTSP